jgi:hypothetical protein
MKMIDTLHQFRGYHGLDGGVCRIEVYVRHSLPPLVVATELPENTNTSVTNLAEYLAAEVGERYLTTELVVGHEPPFVWVERYQRPPHPTRGEHEDWSLVTFAHYRRELTRQNARPPGWRYRIGDPDWRHLSRSDFETLLAPYA